MDHTLEIKGLTHSFGERSIFSDAGISCKTGEITGIFGRNGTGKSTLFKILIGRLKTDKAEIFIDGQFIGNKTNLNSLIAYHPQEIMLPKTMLVRDVIAIYIKEELQNNVHYSRGMAKLENQRVSKLSLGQQRYVQFLLVINLPQHFILLDEPFSMVEPLYKELIKEKLLEYKPIKAFLITDHYYLDVLDIADKACMIKDGKIVSIAKAEDLIRNEYLSERSIIV